MNDGPWKSGSEGWYDGRWETVESNRPGARAAGAGFVVVKTGAMMTMPGLPETPGAVGMWIDEGGDDYGAGLRGVRASGCGERATASLGPRA